MNMLAFLGRDMAVDLGTANTLASWTGIPVSSRSRSSRPRNSAPPPVSAIPRSMALACLRRRRCGGHLPPQGDLPA